MSLDVHIDYEQILERGFSVSLLNDLKILYATATEIQATNILEIGSMCGTSSMILGTVAKEQGGYLQCIEPIVRKPWQENMDAMGLSAFSTMIVGYSPWIDITLINKPIHYLFIDGEHKTRWCLVDYHFFEPFVAIGGRIAFHDWNSTNQMGQGVQLAVDMILSDDRSNLIEIASDDHPPTGIIVFEKRGDKCTLCLGRKKGWCYE